MEDRFIGLAHGNGGRYMRELIEEVFARHLSEPGRANGLDVTVDAARIFLSGEGAPYLTTDGFIVQPLEFPGGDIGSLAVNGTVNDLAVSGARPLYLSLNAFIEEGLEIATLDRIVASLAAAARAAGVRVVAGDTKVLPRGEGGGLYLATTGVGLRRGGVDLGLHRIRSGDKVLVSGPIGDHGIAVLLARQDFQISGDVRSDCGHVIGLTRLGFLHNLAMLTAGTPPDRADGGVTDWVTADDPSLGGPEVPEGDRTSVSFNITVAGTPAGAAVLDLNDDGILLGRRQIVVFPEGEMRVSEQYTRVVIRP